MVTSMAQGRREAMFMKQAVVVGIQRLSPDTQEGAAAIAKLWLEFIIDFADDTPGIAFVHGQVADIVASAAQKMREGN